KAGEDAQIDFGEAQTRGFVIDGDAIMTGQRQFQPTADAEAGNAAHEREFEILYALEQSMSALERFGQNGGIAHLVEFGDIGPRDKARFPGKQHDASQLSRPAQILEMADEG